MKYKEEINVKIPVVQRNEIGTSISVNMGKLAGIRNKGKTI